MIEGRAQLQCETSEGLPIRFYAVTLCRDCGKVDAHMFDVDWVLENSERQPLTCAEVRYQCLPCYYKADAERIRKSWLVENLFHEQIKSFIESHDWDEK